MINKKPLIKGVPYSPDKPVSVRSIANIRIIFIFTTQILFLISNFKHIYLHNDYRP